MDNSTGWCFSDALPLGMEPLVVLEVFSAAPCWLVGGGVGGLVGGGDVWW